jgi:tripartite-type tricarboxylate transporter receptor subunit TctC
MYIRTISTIVLLAAAAFALPARAADDADFPSRPLRIIVPYTPGASTDSISRAFAEEAGKALGKSIIVENRPGAGTAIGTQAAKIAPADGYTILFASGTMISTMVSLKEPGYAVTDFTPVTMLGDQFYVLMTPASLPVKDFKEFVTYAKAHPNKMNYAMLGPGSPSHVLAYRLGKAAGFEWQDIAFKGGTPALQAVMSNDVQGYFATQTFSMGFVNSDKVRLMGIGSEERGAFLPDVPSFKELGFDGVVEQGWYGMFVRSDTPPAIIKKLRTVFAEVMKTDAMKQQLKNNGLTPYKQSIDDVPALLKKEVADKIEVAKRLGIEPQ